MEQHEKSLKEMECDDRKSEYYIKSEYEMQRSYEPACSNSPTFVNESSPERKQVLSPKKHVKRSRKRRNSSKKDADVGNENEGLKVK